MYVLALAMFAVASVIVCTYLIQVLGLCTESHDLLKRMFLIVAHFNLAVEYRNPNR